MRVGNTPNQNEGANGDIRVVSDKSSNYLVFKAGGSWYRVKGEKI